MYTSVKYRERAVEGGMESSTSYRRLNASELSDRNKYKEFWGEIDICTTFFSI